MLRLTGASLALGAVLLAIVLAGLTYSDRSENFAPPIILDPSHVTIQDGSVAVNKAGDLQLRLPAPGFAEVSLPIESFTAQDYAFIHIDIDEAAENLQFFLRWKIEGSKNSGNTTHEYIIENRDLETLWIATRELRGWSGTVTAVHLGVFGPESDALLLRDFSLHPYSMTNLLKAILTDWTAFSPWNRAAMNTHSGVNKVSSFYPVPLTVLFLLCSFAAYGFLLFTVFRKRARFDWHVIGLVFLFGWVCLDLAWQRQLWQQLVLTHQTFAGKTSTEKLAVGPDAALYQFATDLKGKIGKENARIFVISSDDYRGMRSAYYFYPHNVYWRLKHPQLPGKNYFRGGDYILLVHPHEVDYLDDKGWIATKHGRIFVTRVAESPHGVLLQIK